MPITLKPSVMDNMQTIPDPADMKSVIDLFMQWRLRQNTLSGPMTRQQIEHWLHQFIHANLNYYSSIEDNPHEKKEDESLYSRDYDEDQFDDLRIK